MRRPLDWAVGNYVLVGIVFGDKGVPFGKLAEGGLGTEASAPFKGFDHATDTTVPVSSVGLDIMWSWVIAIRGITKGFEGTGGRVGHVGEEVVIGVTLGRRTPDLALEDVATEIARRSEEGTLPKFVHSHSAKETLDKGNGERIV